MQRALYALSFGLILLFGPSALAQQPTWYYCAPLQAYYPYVARCPVPFRAVTPTQQPSQKTSITPQATQQANDDKAATLEHERAKAAAEALAKGLEAGSRQDYAEAMRWYRKAADQGNARAKYNIGVLYERGWGVAQDYAEAMRSYHKAAEQGDVRAQFNIGGLYHNGWGVAQNNAEAMRWYRKAADQGDALGQLNVGSAYANGWDVAQDYAEAMRWFKMAANQGNSDAQFNIGVLYHNGWGVAQDDAEAMRWFRKAADQGNVLAQSNIGGLYYEGWGVAQDYAEAMRWYRMAANQGNRDAQFIVGGLYHYGLGVAQDEDQARAWITKAATSGSEDAKNWLATPPTAGMTPAAVAQRVAPTAPISTSDDSLFPSYDQPTIAQLTYCLSQPANPPLGNTNRGGNCTILRGAVEFHNAFLVRYFGSAAYASYDEYLAMCALDESFSVCMLPATAFAIHNRLSGTTQRPATPPPSPFATLLARKTQITTSEAVATCLSVVERIEDAQSLAVLGEQNHCNSVATVAVEIHKETLANADITWLPSLAERASFIEHEVQKNCLELTQVAASPMTLSDADQDWCRNFGSAAGKFALEHDQAAPGLETSASKMTHNLLTGLIAEFIAAHPEEANQPLAAKMMHTLAWADEKLKAVARLQPVTSAPVIPAQQLSQTAQQPSADIDTVVTRSAAQEEHPPRSQYENWLDCRQHHPDHVDLCDGTGVYYYTKEEWDKGVDERTAEDCSENPVGVTSAACVNLQFKQAKAALEHCHRSFIEKVAEYLIAPFESDGVSRACKKLEESKLRLEEDYCSDQRFSPSLDFCGH